ncbi:MAG TPA: flagellar motor switch phosphatase FliY [Anaerovoracaceae bacterium]|nr:flagellar motor switch phosphatase FliY [Anaerovoracaceae bacterium]
MTNDNENYKLTEMETDVIGEVMNISMGAAATAMSTILDKKVSITTPRIQTLPIDEFEFSYLEPVIGVLIRYIEGVDGTNILLLREEDLKKVLGHLLAMDPSEMVELDEISMSAICEIMNQMMGSAAGALASFLGEPVNISPPEILDTTENMTGHFALTGDFLVSIKFNLSIDGLVESEFLSAMDPQLAKEIVRRSYGASDMEEEAEVPQAAMPAAAPVPTVAEIPAAAASPAGAVPPMAPPAQAAPAAVTQAAAAVAYAAAATTQTAVQAAVETRPYMAPMAEQAPKQPVHAAPYNYKPLGGLERTAAELGIEDNNLELIMSVPIQITVELGKTRKKIKDIAELTVGNIVELNRQAGDQVDVMANGRLIARGDVVVVDDNYSVRITEIIKAKDSSLNEIK